MTLRFEDHLIHFEKIRGEILAAVNPSYLLEQSIRLAGDRLVVKGKPFPRISDSSIFLVSIGKASARMTEGARSVLGSRIGAGVVTLPHGQSMSLPDGFTIIHSGHPIPDEGSMRAGRAVRSLLESTQRDNLVLVLISGGGSAMLELPLEGIQLEDIRMLNDVLLRSGMDIQDINLVRKSISQIKAGGLARFAAPSRCISLILSDVVGDQMSAIASGPTVLRRPSAQQARELLLDHDLWNRVPANIKDALTRTSLPLRRAPWPYNVIIGSNRMAIQTARAACVNLSFEVRILTGKMRGEARELGSRFGKRLHSLARSPSLRTGTSLIMGGESTVTVQGPGRGGRNQELALAAAVEIADVPNIAVMSFASDGIDGPTDAAGAVITGDTAKDWRARGFDPEASLQQNDSFPILRSTNSLIFIGPTGTNVNDIVVGLVYPPEDPP